MDSKRLVRVSKYLSLHLRHEPERLGLEVGPGGWVDVGVLLEACARDGFPVTRAELEEVVVRNDKQRFSFDEAGTRIRANHGHSVEVDLHLVPAVPPPLLYHGTPERSVEAVLREGVKKMARQHVHLSTTVEQARKVGARRGRPVILAVDAAAMHKAGGVFYLSSSGVWLTDFVPAEYLHSLEG
ncbi:MAG: RNA 2'-phosphotransferase [Gemmataceae bacterium]|nr:RNA 2'-phosphotransferase [Gemmataceae bacterium]